MQPHIQPTITQGGQQRNVIKPPGQIIQVKSSQAVNLRVNVGQIRVQD